MPALAGWFHCSVKPISRSTGRSVVAAAAYRLGARMEDHEYGELRDFTRRSGVVTSFTLTPAHAPDWAHNPERLWNAAEASENRRNSQLARECELALPASLTDGQREALVRMFAMDLVERYGVALTAAIHAPSRHGDQKNYHAHILMTTRRMTEEGLGEKTRVLDAKATGPKEIAWMREHACDLINGQLFLAGIDEQVDHRSFKARGIDREPTTHLGPTAADIERRGGESDRGNANRDTEERNRELDALVKEYAALDAEITAEEERRLDETYGQVGPDAANVSPAAPAVGQEAPGTRQQIAGTADAEEAQLDADAAPFIEQIQHAGGVHHDGLAVTWWAHGAAIAIDLYNQGRELIRGLWQKFLDPNGQREGR